MKQLALTDSSIMVTTSMAIGHPGHEAISPTNHPLHHLIDSAHAVMIMATISLFFAVRWLYRRTPSKSCRTTQKH